MQPLNVSAIGECLARAGRLERKVLCVYSSPGIPEGAVPLPKIHRCVTEAIMMLTDGTHPPAYIGKESLGGCCPGGLKYLGYAEGPPLLKFFVSYGSPDFRNGAAEYLKRTPELVEESMKALGKITPLPGNLIIRPCADLTGDDPGVRSVLMFGTAEQVRNLCALNHFCSSDVFGSCLIPWGPTCSNFITYPAGLAEKAPKDAVFVGPVDPTGNEWFPIDMMSVSMPIATAKRICGSIEESFIAKRPKVAYPEERTAL